MVTAVEPRGGKRSEARERLLATASELFYTEGINSIGVNRIVSGSHVTLATFYRHFPSKEALVVAYLQRTHEHVAGQLLAVQLEAEHSLPGNAARHFVMLRDGAMVAGYLDTVRTAQRTFKRGVEGLLRSREIAHLPGTEVDDET